MESFLARSLKIKPIIRIILDKYGKKGVAALREATPKDSGKTAESWSYEIVQSNNGDLRIVWKNDNIQNGLVIAILLQYGHATGNGGYVEGTDYINPAIESIFQQMAKDVWKEVRGK